MKEYTVTIPIAGHAIVTVEADSEEQAKEKAFKEVTSDHIEAWETLESFNSGNVCYCPQPWRVEIEEGEEVEE